VLEWDPCWGKGKAGGLPEVISSKGFGQKAFLINILPSCLPDRGFFFSEQSSRLSLSLHFLSIGSRREPADFRRSRFIPAAVRQSFFVLPARSMPTLGFSVSEPFPSPGRFLVGPSYGSFFLFSFLT